MFAQDKSVNANESTSARWGSSFADILLGNAPGSVAPRNACLLWRTRLPGCSVLLHSVRGLEGWGSQPRGQSFLPVGYAGIARLSSHGRSLTGLSFTCCLSCVVVSLYWHNHLEHLRWGLEIHLFFSHFVFCWIFFFSTSVRILQYTAALSPALAPLQQKAGCRSCALLICSLSDSNIYMYLCGTAKATRAKKKRVLGDGLRFCLQ